MRVGDGGVDDVVERDGGYGLWTWGAVSKE